MNFFIVLISFMFSTTINAESRVVVQQQGPAVGQDYYFYDFGLRATNSQSYKTFNVVNTGDVDLTFKNTFLEGSEYRARHSCKNGLSVGQKCQVEIEFRPKFYGYSTGYLHLNFSEVDTLLFEVKGLSRRPQ